MKIKNILLVLSLIVLGCKDEFVLESYNMEQIMVIDGLISNEPGPYTINLSLAAPISSDENIPLTNCIVTLYENTGKSETLTEKKSGVYVTSKGGIQGFIGNEYSISIIKPDGSEYSSDFQELKQAVELETVYYEIDTTVSPNYSFRIPGYQFYVDTKSSTTQENYFLWDITETFEYDSDYKFEKYEASDGWIWYNKPNLTALRTCWKTQKVNYLFTANTSNLNTPKITHQPLHFVSTETKKLTKKYSILVTQYTTGEKEHKYWQEMEKLISEENYLVATQPYNITGNVNNINNPNEKVYGYFSVASVSQTRIYIDRPNLNFYYGLCTVLTDEEKIADFKMFNGGPYYWVQTDEGTALGSLDCIDCTSEGGTVKMPNFWINKLLIF